MNIVYIAERRTVKYTVAVLLFIAVSLAFSRRIFDYDVWFHLAIGKEILANLRIPQTEVFVYPLLDTPGAYHAWGFGVLVYFLYDHFGYWGISCLSGILAGLLAVLLYLAASRGKPLEGWALLLLSGLLVLVEFRFVHRPETVLYLFLAMYIFSLERFSSTRNRKWLFPLPAISLLLSWFHPTALVLMIVFFSYVLGFLWDWIRSRKIDRRMGITLALVFISSILGALVNPYGIKQLLLPILFAGEKTFQHGVPELSPILETMFKNRFILLIIVGLVPFFALRNGRRITYILLFSFFAYLTFKYARNLALMAIVLYVPIVLSFQTFTENSAWLSRVVSNKFFSVLPAVLLIVTTLSFMRHGRWGADPANDLFPVKSAQFMLEHRPQGRIFNHFHSGNYLEWKLYPSYRVSIDGRHYTYDKSLELYEQVFWLKDGWQRVLLGYHVETIITPGTNIVEGSLVPLVLELDADPSWSLVVIEPAAMLFVRTEQLENLPGVQILNKNLIWTQVIQETLNNLKNYPDAVKSYLSLGIAYFKLHEFHSALGPFREYLRHFPDDTQALQVVSLIESAEVGDLASAEELEALYSSGRYKPN